MLETLGLLTVTGKVDGQVGVLIVYLCPRLSKCHCEVERKSEYWSWEIRNAWIKVLYLLSFGRLSKYS